MDSASENFEDEKADGFLREYIDDIGLVYCRDINKSFENPNFCPIFYPDGCQFSNEQIQSFESVNAYDWREFALARKNYSFQQLYTNDKQKSIWNKIVNYYSQLYGIRPKPMINYEMLEEDKKLFSNKAL